MPVNLLCCVSLPPATISSVPINDFANANERFENKDMQLYYHVAGRVFVKGVNTPLFILEMTSVHFATPTEAPKQRKSVLNN